MSCLESTSDSPIEKLFPANRSITVAECVWQLEADVGFVDVGGRNRTAVPDPPDDHLARLRDDFRELAGLEAFGRLWQERQRVLGRVEIWKRKPYVNQCLEKLANRVSPL